MRSPARRRDGQMSYHLLAMTRLPLLCLLSLAPATSRAEPVSAAPESAVRRTLQDQVTAWNRGDLEGYMAGYWRSPELTFYSGATITQGWQPTLDRYRRRYQGQGSEMGQLTFADVHVALLGPDAALARGGWHLRSARSPERRGLFTVILRRLPEGWRIVHDHSSGP